jgi:hypothetical protein
MMQHPAVIALLGAALLITAMLLYAGYHGIRIIRAWDPASGSEGQLALERLTYLISTLVAYALFFQLLSLFLYIYTAESIHHLFAGAMCAAGTLNVNGFGYPVLLLKTVNALAAGVWLIVNHLDSRGYDYPLIRPKYGLLLVLTLLVTVETLLQFGYFRGLRTDLITSCCGSLFSSESQSLAGEVAAFPARPMMVLFGATLAAAVASGALFLRSGRGARLFALAGGCHFLTAALSLVSFIALYFYELPTHHCPFCLLQREYGHVGYLLYACLFTGGVAAAGVGILDLCRGHASLARAIPPLQRRLAVIALAAALLYGATAGIRIVTTSFRL